MVPKRPLWRRAHSVEGYVGSDGSKRGALDSTGPIGENLAYRLNIAAEDRDSFRGHIDARRQVIAPAITWKPGRDTALKYAGARRAAASSASRPTAR